MAWRYSASTYTPRDRSASRDSSTTSSKYGLPSSLSSSYSTSERPSRWSSPTTPPSRSNSIEEHAPVWAKTTLHSSPSSVVQRLKDRYSTDAPKSAPPPPPKRTETKDLTLPLQRTYGRTATTTYGTTGRTYGTETKKEPVESTLPRMYGEKAKSTLGTTTKADADKAPSLYSSRTSLRKRSPEPEKTSSGYEYRTRKPDYAPMESKPKVYTSSSLGSSPATSRYLGNKSRSGSSAGSTPNTPTTPSTERNYVLEKFEKANQQELEENSVLVITRGTSPSEPSASIYVRTRRADSERTIEKTIQRAKIRPKTADKECQADEVSQTMVNKYSTYSTDRVKPRASYVGSGITTYTPLSRYSGRASSYAPVTTSRYDSSDFRRSVSRDIGPTHSEVESRSSRRSEEPALVKPVDPTRSPKITSPSRPTSTTPGRDLASKMPSPSISSSETLSKSSQLSQKTKSVLSPDRSESKEKSAQSLVISVTTREKSKTPSQSDGNNRARSKTQESDTSISVSGFSDSSKSSPKPISISEKSATKQNSTSEKSAAKAHSTSEKSAAKVSSTSEKSGAKASSASEKSNVKLNSTGGSPNAFKMSVSPKTQAEDDSSESESESESDETATTTTDSETADEVEELTKSSEPSSIKRSITNFLQNLPTTLSTGDNTSKSRSRLSLFRGKSGSTAKFKFKRHESGERAWWMDSTGDVPEGVTKLAASNKSIHHLADKNHLAPSPLANRQFSRDKDWLRNSSEDGSDRSASSPLPPRPPSTPSPHQQNSSSPSRQPAAHVPGDSTLFLDVPQLPVIRQWSDEKPWWQTENENSSKDNSISVEKVLSSKSSHAGMNGISENDCDVRYRVDDLPDLNACDNLARISPAKSSSRRLSPERTTLNEEDGEDIDVTPALRRRRELQQAGLIEDGQQGIPDYQMKFNKELDEKVNHDTKNLLEECKLECSVRDLTQKLAAVTNGISSPVEEKAITLEAEGMSGMISKAKAGLIKSQTKQLSRQNSEEQPEQIKDIEKSEIDIYWKELVESLDRPLTLGDLDFTDLTADDEKDMFGHSRMNGGIPPPPPPFMTNGPAPPPPANPPPPLRKAPAPPPPPIVKNKKTVKLFWKEVTDSMHPVRPVDGPASIWDEILSVTVDTGKLEHLFESRAKDLITKKQQEQNKTKAIIVLDNKRSNAINIGMTKLPPPRAIKAAILKMDSSVVTKEGIEKLLGMLPTEEERVRIQDAQLANPELPLGSAEQFLLTLTSISELEARLKLWAFKLEFENSEKEICEPLLDLKQGIDILRSNKTFRGILSTLLSIGNFLNGQEAKGFQIDYLSKVPEVKDTVNKHSLLHHLSVFVMEKFPDSTDLYSEIGAVTRASKTDFDELAANIKKLEDDCKCSWNHLKIIAKHEGQTAMKAKMSDFLADCAERIILIGTVHRRVMGRFHKFVMWLGVPMNRVTTTRPQELFKTIAEFSLEYRTTRERILQQLKKVSHHRDKSRSRLNLMSENRVPAENHVGVKKLNSKEAKEDAKLRQLLDDDRSTTSEAFNQTATWRRQKKQTPVVNNDLNGDDNEIIETLIKTAKQTPSSREMLKERRRSRMLDRKAMP